MGFLSGIPDSSISFPNAPASSASHGDAFDPWATEELVKVNRERGEAVKTTSGGSLPSRGVAGAKRARGVGAGLRHSAALVVPLLQALLEPRDHDLPGDIALGVDSLSILFNRSF